MEQKDTHLLRSHFHFYSFGIVVGDKERNEAEIIVFPTESQMEYTGSVESVQTLSNLSATNELENSSNFTVDLDQKLEATWVSIGQDNRISIPDVCNGEVVMLFKFGESNVIFWDTCFVENKLRRKEHRVIAVSNTDDVTELLHEGNMYWQSLDSRDKKVQMIYTADNDEEETTWDFHIKTDEGYLVIVDGKGNKFHMDAANDQISISAQSKIKMDAPDIEINCETLQVTATKGTIDVQKLTMTGMQYTNTFQSSSFESTMFELNGATIIIQGVATITPPLLTTSTVAQS